MTTASTEAPTLPEHIGEVEPGWKCNSCEHITNEEPEGTLYECGDCSTVFGGDEGNRCPQCNKFAARSEDGNACGECGEGAAEPTEVRHCTACDTTFEVGDEDDHEHDPEDEEEAGDGGQDDAGWPTGGTKRERERRATWPVPVLVPKRAADLKAGDMLAKPQQNVEAAVSGGHAPFHVFEVTSDASTDLAPADEPGSIFYWSGSIGTTRHADEIVHVVTGWEHPPGMKQVPGRDLTITMLMCDPDNPRARSPIAEVTHDLLAHTVTVKSGFGRVRPNAPEHIFGEDEQVLVVDIGKPNRFLGKTAWRVDLDGKLDTPFLPGDGLKANPGYDRTEAVMDALTAAGIDLTGRKVTARLSGGYRSGEPGWLLIVDKHRTLADKAIEVFAQHEVGVRSITQTTVQ